MHLNFVTFYPVFLCVVYWCGFSRYLASQTARNGDLITGLAMYSVAQLCPTLCNPVNCSLPGSSAVRLSRQEYWSGVPFPSVGELPDPGIKPTLPESPAPAGRFSTTAAPGFCYSAPLSFLLCFFSPFFLFAPSLLFLASLLASGLSFLCWKVVAWSKSDT